MLRFCQAKKKNKQKQQQQQQKTNGDFLSKLPIYTTHSL